MQYLYLLLTILALFDQNVIKNSSLELQKPTSIAPDGNRIVQGTSLSINAAICTVYIFLFITIS